MSRTRSHAEETASLVGEASGNRPMTLELDQTDPSAIDAGFQEAVEKLGSIDVLSNNAGVRRADGASGHRDIGRDLGGSTFPCQRDRRVLAVRAAIR